MKQWQLNVLRRYKNVLSISRIHMLTASQKKEEEEVEKERKMFVLWTRCNDDDDDNFDFITCATTKSFFSLLIFRRNNVRCISLVHFTTFRRKRYFRELITFYYNIELKADAEDTKFSNDTCFIRAAAHILHC